MPTINTKLISDGRIRSLSERTLDKHFSYTFTDLNLEEYTEHLVKETVLECMKQLALPLDMSNPFHKTLIQNQWDHLALRYEIHE
jgi:hypothetical protein